MADCTIIDKLNYILETKDLIKTALETQDVEVLESDTFRKYSEYITEIRKVASVNGETGDIVLKTINGQNLVGEGNIVIQGGEGGGSEPEQYIKMLGEEYPNNLIWYTNEKDDYREIKFKTINGNSIMGEGNIIIQGGEGGGGITEETDPIFTEWKNGDSIALGKDSTNEGSNNIAIGNTVKVNGEYSIVIGASSIYDDAEFYTEANGIGSIAIGNETIANNTSLAIGSYNTINKASVALGMGNTINSENSFAIGNDNSLKDGSFKFAYGFFNTPKNDQEINIGILCDSKTGETDAEKTHFVISSAQNRKGEDYSSCFEIRNDDSIYIKMNGQLVKLQDKLNINIPETDLSDYYTKGEVYNKNEVNELIDEVNVGDVDLTNYYTKQEVDDKIPSLNGYATEQWVEDKGYLTEHQQLKTINGESIIGEGNITIEGGGSSGVEYIASEENPSDWDKFYGGVKLFKSWIDLDDDGEQETLDIRIGGDLQDGSNGSTLWYGFTSSDNSILLSDYSSRLDLKVNPDILGGGTSSDNTYTAGDGISITDNTITNTGVTAINIGRDIQDWTQKNGVVSFYSDWYDGSYDVAIGGTSFFGIKPIDNSIILENAGGTVNGNTRCGIKINTDNFKTINGESIIGEGNITIEGGSGSGTINIIELTQAEYDALTEYADNTFYVITDANKQYTTLEEVEQQGYLKAIPDTYVTDGELSTAISDKVSQNALNEAIEGLASEQWVEDKKYLTEHQQLKTINGESIVGEGNITIEGGTTEETDPVFTEWKDKTIQVIIGSGATGSDNTQFDNISIGRGARGGNRTVAIGGYSYIDSKFSTSLGTNTKSSADATYSVIIGYSASGNSENSVAIGAKAKVESGVTNGCAIGANTESNATFNTNINNVLKGDTSNYAYILDADGNYVKIIDTYYTKTEIDNLIGGVSDKISDINSMI